MNDNLHLHFSRLHYGSCLTCHDCHASQLILGPHKVPPCSGSSHRLSLGERADHLGLCYWHNRRCIGKLPCPLVPCVSDIQLLPEAEHCTNGSLIETARARKKTTFLPCFMVFWTVADVLLSTVSHRIILHASFQPDIAAISSFELNSKRHCSFTFSHRESDHTFTDTC